LEARQVIDVTAARQLVAVLAVLAVAVLWLWLLNSWRVRNWRGVTFTIVGTIAFVLASLLPAPVRGLAMGGTWLAVAWILVFHPDVVGVMTPQAYDYVDAHIEILRRIGRRKHARRHLDAEASVQAFEADVRVLKSLIPPPGWVRLHAETIRELDRRLTVMKVGIMPTAEEQKSGDQRWLEIGQLFRDLLKARAGFWTGWPHVVRRPSA
jgi:hypothetical protein